MQRRSQIFASRSHNRYWWYRLRDSQYLPPIFQALTDQEWEILNDWFYDTEQRFTSPGEIGVPGFSLMAGLIGGNGIRRVVQCGHYVGFSSLMLGFLMRSMAQERSVYSVDIDPAVTAYSSSWLVQAGLTAYVKLEVNDSADGTNAAAATEWLGGAPQLVLIDSSHQYAHTLRELDLWYDELTPGGLLLLHDVSIFAQQFDSTGAGGVLPAVREWCQRREVQPMLLNSFVQFGQDPNELVYKDGCGLGVIQKPNG